VCAPCKVPCLTVNMFKNLSTQGKKYKTITSMQMRGHWLGSCNKCVSRAMCSHLFSALLKILSISVPEHHCSIICCRSTFTKRNFALFKLQIGFTLLKITCKPFFYAMSQFAVIYIGSCRNKDILIPLMACAVARKHCFHYHNLVFMLNLFL